MGKRHVSYFAFSTSPVSGRPAAIPPSLIDISTLNALRDAEKVADAVKHAWSSGVEYVDCSSDSQNEKQIGNALSGFDRSSFYVGSKLSCCDAAPEDVTEACKRSIAELGVSYLDNYMMHWPVQLKSDSKPVSLDDGDTYELLQDGDMDCIMATYEAMERLVDQGLVRSLGVSNMGIRTLSELLSRCRIRPTVLEVEMHPYLAQPKLLEFCREENIHVMANSPPGKMRDGYPDDSSLLDDPILLRIAEESGRSAAQVLLRWGIQRGRSITRKTLSQSLIDENKDVLDWCLSRDHMSRLDALGKGSRLTSFCFFPGSLDAAPSASAKDDCGVLEWLAIESVATVSIFAAILGYDIGVMSGALLAMSRDLDLSTWQQEIVVGCLDFVSAAGAIGGGALYVNHGMVRCVRLAILSYAAGMIIVAASFSYVQVFIGRIVGGIGVGLGFAICPQYIAEICPPAWRGIMVSCFEISMNLGLCSGYVANLALETLADSTRWRLLMLIPLVPTSFMYFISVPRLPESPRWLMADGREAEASDTLVRLCGEAAAGPTMLEIKEVIALQDNYDHEGQRHGASPGSRWAALFTGPVARRALFIGAGTAIFQQANGLEAVVYYVPKVLDAAGVTSEHAQLKAAALVGLCKTLFIGVGQFSVDKFGRRVVMLSSISAVTCSLLVLAWCIGSGNAEAGVILTALCAFMASFSLGVGPGTWVITSEIFPLPIRSKGTSFSMAANRITSGTVAMTFLSLSAWLGVGGAFFLFAGVSAVHFLFTFFMLPETRGKSLEEIEAMLSQGSRSYERF